MASKIKLLNSQGSTATLENNDSNLNDYTIDIAKITKSVDTVEDLASLTDAVDTVIVKDKDRGGIFNAITSTTANNGTIFDGNGCSWERQYDGAVNFKMFGAKGDGITDDTTALQATFNIGLPIHDYTESIYLFSTNINVGDVELKGNCTFNGTSNAFINVTGSLTEIGYVGVATDKKTNTITLNTVSGLSVDDVIIIHNTTPSSLSPARPYYYDGEYAEIIDINTETLTLKNVLKSSYTASSTNKIFKLNHRTVNIDGVKFKSDGVFGCRIQFAKDIYCNNIDCDITGHSSALFLSKVYNGSILNSKFYTPYESVGNPSCYGIGVSNCENILIDNCIAYGGRHSVSVGGADDNGAVPSRNIRIRNSILYNDRDSNIYNADLHGNSIDSGYDNCEVYGGGVGLAGVDPYFKNGVVYGWDDADTSTLVYHELIGGVCLFENNKVYVGKNSTAPYLVNNSGSSLTALIDRPYIIRVSGLLASINTAVIGYINAYENSGQPNSWEISDFGITDGLASQVATIINFTNYGGLDPTFIKIEKPKFIISDSYTLVAKTGTTLADVIYTLPVTYGSNANGSWIKQSDGSMVCRLDFSQSSAISTAFLGGFRTSGLTWTYPKEYIDNPELSITPDGATCFSGVVSTAGTSSALFFLTSISNEAAATRSAKLIAIGRYI